MPVPEDTSAAPTPQGVAGSHSRRKKSETEKRGYRAAYARLRRFAAEGGVLLREEIGGVVGVRWCSAKRHDTFPASVCEKWVKEGKLVPAHLLAETKVPVDRTDLFVSTAAFLDEA